MQSCDVANEFTPSINHAFIELLLALIFLRRHAKKGLFHGVRAICVADRDLFFAFQQSFRSGHSSSYFISIVIGHDE